MCAPYSFVHSSNSSDALCTIKNREDALLSIVPSWTFCPSVTLCRLRRHGERRPSPDCSVLSQVVDNRLASKLPPPTCLLSRINGVTRCVRAPVRHRVCGPGPARRPDRLHFSFFIVDIYFCNYRSTSPSVKDDMMKLTPPLPSVSLLLPKRMQTRSSTDTCT